ncbi:MAG: FHA domain-containing protein [Planctomycetes bacterium]|nr:FHA domain-containing protein [Planctomycetota bacterium]
MIPTLLVRPPSGLPLRLQPGGQLRIGRKVGNDIVLDSTQVSREHAVLVWAEEAERASLMDLGSANGVTLDGVKVQGSRVLGLVGTIQIGIMKITYEQEDGGSDIAASFNLPDDSESFVLERGEQFSGTFDDADDLADTLRGLERAKRSGTLRVTGVEKEGVIQFAQGLVMSSSWSSLSGLAALEKILKIPEGRYVMVSRLVPSDEFLNLKISEFLARGF